MLRINLKNDVMKKHRRQSGIAQPRVVVAVGTACIALGLWACNSADFGGPPPDSPAQKPKKTEQNLSPNEDGKTENRSESEPVDPKRALVLQIKGVQPEGWWNNCLKIELDGKSFDIACTKDANVMSKVVRIPVPEGVTCPVLDLRIETFKNVGEACNQRVNQGLACEGPYESSPSAVRKYSSSADRVHFVLTEGVTAGSGRLIRAFFEDQSANSIAQAKEDSARAESLGVDFNDAIFELSTLELPFEIRGAPGTKCR